MSEIDLEGWLRMLEMDATEGRKVDGQPRSIRRGASANETLALIREIRRLRALLGENENIPQAIFDEALLVCRYTVAGRESKITPEHAAAAALAVIEYDWGAPRWQDPAPQSPPDSVAPPQAEGGK